jgi:hypothetical protein
MRLNKILLFILAFGKRLRRTYFILHPFWSGSKTIKMNDTDLSEKLSFFGETKSGGLPPKPPFGDECLPQAPCTRVDWY